MSTALLRRMAWARQLLTTAASGNPQDTVESPPEADHLARAGLEPIQRDLLWLAAALSLDGSLRSTMRKLRPPGHPERIDVALCQHILARDGDPHSHHAILTHLEHLEVLGFLHLDTDAPSPVERRIHIHHDVLAWLQSRPRAHSLALHSPDLRVYSAPASTLPPRATHDSTLRQLLDTHLGLEQTTAEPARILVLRGEEGCGRTRAVRDAARRLRNADTLTFDAAGATPHPDALWHAAREAALHGEVLIVRHAEPMVARGGVAVAGMLAALWRWPSRIVTCVAEDAPPVDPRLKRWLFWQHHVRADSELMRVRRTMAELMPEVEPRALWWPSARKLARLNALQLRRCVEAWRALPSPQPDGPRSAPVIQSTPVAHHTHNASHLRYHLQQPTRITDDVSRFAAHVQTFCQDRSVRSSVDDEAREVEPEIVPLYGLPAQSAPPDIPELTLPETGVPVFVGLASRGPLTPVELHAVEDFETHFDPATGSFLHACIEGFFANGGRRCYALRVACTERKARTRGRTVHRPVATARCTLRDLSREGRLTIHASSPGTWGNALTLTLTPQEPTMHASRIDGGDWYPTGGKGFEVGAHIDIVDIGNKANRIVHTATLTRLDDRVEWTPRGDVKAKMLRLVRRDAFALTVRAPASEHHRRERHEHHPLLTLAPSSPDYVVTALNTRSHLLRAQDLRTRHARVLLGEMTLSMTGGHDGPENLNPSHLSLTQLTATLSNLEDVDLIAFPDMHLLSHEPHKVLPLYRALIEAAEARADRLALLSLPPETPPRHAQKDPLRVSLKSPFAMLLYPALNVPARRPKDTLRAIPPEGHVAGLLARSDREEGIHRNIHLPLTGFTSLAHELREDTLRELAPISLLAERRPVSEVRLYFERTLAEGPNHRLDDRRLLNALTHALRAACGWAAFETHPETLRDGLYQQIGDFLERLKADGVLLGEPGWKLELRRVPEGGLELVLNVALHHPEQFERIHVQIDDM